MGDNSPQNKIQINVPEFYKSVDESVWEELENYIFSGFLTSKAEILNHQFIFKSLNHNEIKLIRQLQPVHSTDEQQKFIFRSAFIAYSCYLIDGENALYDRPRHIRKLIKTISKFPSNVQDEIVSRLSKLNDRSSRLYPLVEIYVYENRSRFRWMHIQDNHIHSPLNTGIHGTENLGMNYCQQTWVSLNKFSDKRDAAEREWSNAKFIGSCFAGKGVRNIDEKDKARVERERVEREELKMNVLYNYLNRSSDRDKGPNLEIRRLPDGRSAVIEKKFQSESVQELARELESALNNEKDYHDLAIEKYKKEMEIKMVEIERSKNDMWKSPISEEIQDLIQAGGGSRVIGGKDKADEYISRIRKLRQEQLEKTRLQLRPGQEPSDKTDK